MQEDTPFFAPVREVEVVNAGAERASTCVDAQSHQTQGRCTGAISRRRVAPSHRILRRRSATQRDFTSQVMSRRVAAVASQPVARTFEGSCAS